MSSGTNPADLGSASDIGERRDTFLNQTRRLSKPAIVFIVVGVILFAGLLAASIYVSRNLAEAFRPPSPSDTLARELAAKYRDLENDIKAFEVSRDATLIPKLTTSVNKFQFDLLLDNSSLKHLYPAYSVSDAEILKPKIESALNSIVSEIDYLEQTSQADEIPSSKGNDLRTLLDVSMDELRFEPTRKITLCEFHAIKGQAIANVKNALMNLSNQPFVVDHFKEELEGVKSSLANLIREDKKCPVFAKDDMVEDMVEKIYAYYLPDLINEYNRLFEDGKDNSAFASSYKAYGDPKMANPFVGGVYVFVPSDLQNEFDSLKAILKKVKTREDFIKFKEAFATLKSKFDSSDTVKTLGSRLLALSFSRYINELAKELYIATENKQRSVKKLDLDIDLELVT